MGWKNGLRDKKDRYIKKTTFNAIKKKKKKLFV